jgi:hypothetical protein
MKVLELFSGTGNVSRHFRDHGHECFRVDWSEKVDSELRADILTVTSDQILELFGQPDVIWASPDCTTFSVMSMGHYWEKRGAVYYPRNEKAVRGGDQVKAALRLIAELKPRYWFIENPMGGLRVMPFMKGVGKRRTVTYCQYGERYQKPTDIWTNNLYWHPRPRCFPGDPCHVAAPRGSKTGIQCDNMTPLERGRIPDQLCQEIVRACDGGSSIVRGWFGDQE